MSEPDIDWHVDKIKGLLGEIDTLILTSPTITNSIKEIIIYNTNEVEITLHIILRKAGVAKL